MNLSSECQLRTWPWLSCAAALSVVASAASAADYPTTILGDNPVAYYRLEETSGTTAADSSPNHLDAAYIRDSTGVYPKLGQPGIDVNSVLFNGGSDF